MSNELKKRDNRGRPPMPGEKKMKHARMALYPHTHKVFKQKAKESKMNLVDFMEELAKSL